MPIVQNLAAVRRRVAAACAAAGRAPESVTLVAVSKGVDAARMAAARAAGQVHFGESYLQEALPKLEALGRAGLVWHFVGPLQANKTAGVAAAFDWVHGLDREKIARRLAAQRPPALPPLQVCVQVNISGEASKAGVAPGEAAALCRVVAALPALRLRGLMAIPAPAHGGDARAPFRALRELRDALGREGFELDTLSAGMSDDLEAAVTEGSTMVRIGTAIFGART